MHHPITSGPGQAGNAQVAIYLPRGPVLGDGSAERDASNVSLMRSTLSCPIVQINYRCSKAYQYPTAIHDLAAGVDWVVNNLLPKRAFARSARSEHVGQLAVCGELIGGQLATTLALTECRIGEPAVVAAAVNSPITNWIDLDEKGTSHSIASSLTMKNLFGYRNMIFRKSEHYFDPFASPTMFFRSAGVDVPVDIDQQPMDDLAELALLDREDFFREQQILSNIGNDSEHIPRAQDQNASQRKRKASRRFPSKELGLRLPAFHVSSGADSPLRASAKELAHLLRQSLARQESRARSPFGRKLAVDDEAQRMVTEEMLTYHEHSGMGLWDTTKAGQARMKDVAGWMAERLMSR